MQLASTQRFSVLQIPHYKDVEHLREFGFVLSPKRGKETSFLSSSEKRLFEEFLLTLQRHYDAVDDSFGHHLDLEAFQLTRLPRIGRGKHNVHFDAMESPLHQILAAFSAARGIEALLSRYLHKDVALRETGLSVTRPCLEGDPGEGMVQFSHSLLYRTVFPFAVRFN